MKRNYKLYLTIVSILFLNINLFSQCQQFQADFIGSTCNDNGTPLDPSDDTFMARVSVDNGLNPNGTWSSSDGSYTNEPYPPFIFTFGPYPISGGNVSVIITDDQVNCPPDNVVMIAPASCSEPPFVCPDFDLCYQLIDQGTCSATYLVNIGGNLGTYTNINNINFTFSASGGTIDGVAFADETGYFLTQGVQISGNTVYGGSTMEGDELTTNNFVVTVSAEPGQCVTLSHGVIIMYFGSNPCVVFNSNICPAAPQYCATGTNVRGNVTADAQIYDCPDTQNHGIAGVDITVISPNGDTCNTTTTNDGTYSCTFCDDGPFTICAEADCPDPCGVTDYDLVLLRQYVLGIKAFTKDIWFIGDVDTNRSISTLDLIRLQREILGLDTNFIKNWCRFVPVSDYASAPNPNGPNTGADYQAIDNCVSTANGGSTDFLRYIIGDVDGSCTDCIHGDGQGSLGLVTQDNGQGLLKLKLPTSQSTQLLTLHLSIPQGVNIVNIWSPLPNFEYNIRNGELHIIWIDESEAKAGAYINSSDAIVEISYTGLSAPSLVGKENWVLKTDGTIYKLTKQGEEPSLRSHDTKEVNIANLAIYEVANTVQTVNIELYDVLGRLVHTSAYVTTDYIELQDLPLQGVFILRVSDGVMTTSKKVFIK